MKTPGATDEDAPTLRYRVSLLIEIPWIHSLGVMCLCWQFRLGDGGFPNFHQGWSYCE